MQIAVGQLGVSYGDFWQMPPRHFWWLHEAHRQMQDRAGRNRAEWKPEEYDEVRALIAREQAALDRKHGKT